MKKISVIMPSYLGDYPGAATNREFKFERAVVSFINNDYPNKNLIIVADGCPKTKYLYEKKFENHSNINLVYLKKQPLFSGNVRQAGLVKAKQIHSNYICYLDSDDILYPFHLRAIVNNFGTSEWVYFNDFIAMDPTLKKLGRRDVKLQFGSAGVSAIAHTLIDGLDWEGCDGYGHDWTFIQKLIALSSDYHKIKDNYAGYLIMHLPGQKDY